MPKGIFAFEAAAYGFYIAATFQGRLSFLYGHIFKTQVFGTK
jgi:hypothetical protein